MLIISITPILNNVIHFKTLKAVKVCAQNLKKKLAEHYKSVYFQITVSIRLSW